MNRIDALRQETCEKKSFDGVLIANAANLFYFSGVQGASCLLIPKRGENTIYVYGTNYEQARTDGKGFNVELVKRDENLMEKIGAQVKACKIKKLAIDALSAENYRSLARSLRGKVKLKAQNEIVWSIRKIKDKHEIELMRKAGELTTEGVKVAYETITPGIKEIDVAAEIEYAMRKKGSWGTAFETIVASGARSAFPHGGCTERKIQEGDLVVVDIGATYHFYCSDTTRTLVAGKPSKKQEKLYEIVKTAYEKAYEAIEPGARAKEVDGAARTVIDKAGYGQYFVHGLGHGVGIEVHEPPTLGQQSKDKLMIGNVVTNEPGIYLIGFGGVRIEDSVLVQKHQAEKLTKGPYTLQTEK